MEWYRFIFIFREKILKSHIQSLYDQDIKKAPTPKVDAPKRLCYALTDTAHPVDQTGWAIKLPKDISNANIPIKIEIISYAVMGATSFPMYSGEPVLQVWEVATPVVSAFLISILAQEHTFCNFIFISYEICYS